MESSLDGRMLNRMMPSPLDPGFDVLSDASFTDVLPALTQEEMDDWWHVLGGDEALEKSERALDESMFVSDALLSSMVR